MEVVINKPTWRSWSNALDLRSSLLGGMGSNPIVGKLARIAQLVRACDC